MRFFIAVLFLVSSSVAWSNPVWLEKELLVEDVLVYSQGRYSVMSIKFSSSEALNSGCVPTDTHQMLSYWYEGDFNGAMRSRISTLLAAQAQELPIRVFADLSDCNTVQVWDAYGAPYGLGARFYGVRVIK